MKQHKAEKSFADLNSAMQQYFLVTGRQLEPLPPKPVLSDFYVPSEDHHNNNKKRSHTQLDSRKQVIAFQDRVMTINIKEAQHPLK